MIVIQENVDAISAARAKAIEIEAKATELQEFLLRVFNRVRLDWDINDDTDWDVIVARYSPEYVARKNELVALLGAMP